MYTMPYVNYDSMSYLGEVPLTGTSLPVVPILYAATLRQLGGPYSRSADTSFRHSPALASFRSWMHQSGERIYLEYSLVHPWWVLTGTFGHHEELNSRVLTFYGGEPHRWLPEGGRQVLLVCRQTTPALATVAAIVLVLRRRFLRSEGPAAMGCADGHSLRRPHPRLGERLLGDRPSVGGRHGPSAYRPGFHHLYRPGLPGQDPGVLRRDGIK
jgi:hypothetical protein